MTKFLVIAVASIALLGSAAASWAESAKVDAGAAASSAPSTQRDAVTRYENALDQAFADRLEPGPDAYRLYDQAHQAAPWLPDPGMAADENFQTE